MKLSQLSQTKKKRHDSPKTQPNIYVEQNRKRLRVTCKCNFASANKRTYYCAMWIQRSLGHVKWVQRIWNYFSTRFLVLRKSPLAVVHTVCSLTSTHSCCLHFVSCLYVSCTWKIQRNLILILKPHNCMRFVSILLSVTNTGPRAHTVVHVDDFFLPQALPIYCFCRKICA